jgi:hypothetical protein
VVNSRATEEFYNTFGIDPTGGDVFGSNQTALSSTLDHPSWDVDPRNERVVALEAHCEDLTNRLKHMEMLVANAGKV